MGKSRLFNGLRSAYPFAKRVMDIVVSAISLIFLVPVIMIIAIIVKVTSKGPVIFWSSRMGHHGKAFMMPKFRTMTVNSKLLSRELAQSHDIELTPVGLFLRKTSLDEIPQFLSVLKGDMSLIGPRPLLLNDQASGARMKTPIIYTVRPGITGLAQVNGRNFIKPNNKVRYDAFYAKNVCMILDAKILVKTIRTVFDPKLVQ